jgi:RNA polymerase sigma-70 factor (ECF subfamily)
MSKADLEKAFLEGVAAHQGILHRIGRIYFAAGTDREDFLQQALLNAWRSFPRFEGRSAFSTWLYRVALNTALMQRRREPESVRPRGALDDLDALPAPAPRPDEEEALSRLRRAIMGLGSIDRSIVLLYLEELSYCEIAEITGLTENHIGVRLNRIKGRLRERLENEEDRHGP